MDNGNIFHHILSLVFFDGEHLLPKTLLLQICCCFWKREIIEAARKVSEAVVMTEYLSLDTKEYLIESLENKRKEKEIRIEK